MGGFGANVARVAYAVASNGDASAVGIRFFGRDFADNLGVSYFLVDVGRDSLVVDNKGGGSAVEALVGAFRVGAYALVETIDFV